MRKVFIGLIFLSAFLLKSVSAYITEQDTIEGVSLKLDRFTTVGSEDWVSVV